MDSPLNLSVLLNGLTGVFSNWTTVRLSDGAAVRLPRASIVTVHMVTRGACRLRAGPHAQADLTIGDVAIVLQGVVQILSCGAAGEAEPFAGDTGRSDIDVPSTQVVGSSDTAPAASSPRDRCRTVR